MRGVLTLAAVVVVLGGTSVYLSTTVAGQSAEFANFEGAQTNPIRLSPDGTRLFAVNTANASLSVFDVANPTVPVLIREIPVGLEPVSVNPRTNDEAWVVNQLSDSVSIVSVSRGIVIATLNIPDEPMDVVFAGVNQAYVSVSRNNAVAVFDTTTRALTHVLPLFGGNPRALAVSPDGTQGVCRLCPLRQCHHSDTGRERRHRRRRRPTPTCLPPRRSRRSFRPTIPRGLRS